MGCKGQPPAPLRRGRLDFGHTVNKQKNPRPLAPPQISFGTRGKGEDRILLPGIIDVNDSREYFLLPGLRSLRCASSVSQAASHS